MAVKAPARARLTRRRPPGTAAGAASASPSGGAAPRRRRRRPPRPRRRTRGATSPGRSSPWSRPTTTTTRPIRTACWTPTRMATTGRTTARWISPPTSRGSSGPCCSPGSTSSPCACSAATRGSLLSRPGSRASECGSSTPTVTSGKQEAVMSHLCIGLV